MNQSNPRIAFAFSSKDRVEFSRRSLKSIDLCSGFDLIWVDGSITEEGKNLPSQIELTNTRFVEINKNITGGPDNAIRFGLKRALDLGYDYCGLIENDIEFSADWFPELEKLFQLCENEGLNCGAATVRSAESRILVNRFGYSLNWNMGAGIVLFTREAAEIILQNYGNTSAKKIDKFYNETFGVDVAKSWELYCEKPDRELGADWPFAMELYRRGLCSAQSIPTYAINIDLDLEEVCRTKYVKNKIIPSYEDEKNFATIKQRLTILNENKNLSVISNVDTEPALCYDSAYGSGNYSVINNNSSIGYASSVFSNNNNIEEVSSQATASNSFGDFEGEIIRDNQDISNIQNLTEAEFISITDELLSKGNILEAEKLCLTYLGLNPDSSEGFNQLGGVFFLKADFPSAKTLFEKAVQLDPNNLNPQRNLNELSKISAVKNINNEKLKVAEDYSAQLDLTEINTESEFATSIENIFQNYRPKKIIETGTYLGTGTTSIIASTIKKMGYDDFKFFSIEVNPLNFNEAKKNIAEAGLEKYVTLLNGLSMPRNLLPSIHQIKNHTVDNVEYENIFVDHHEANRPEKYFNETNFNDIDDDLLDKCLWQFEYSPDFILLDSAGHIGFEEFKYVIDRLKKDCIIALDDIYHIKHHKSFIYMQNDSRFQIIISSKEKFGFCIAKFSPAVEQQNQNKTITKQILFVRTDSIGDNLIALTTLEKIHNAYPKAEIDVICQNHIAELYEAVPFVSKILSFDERLLFDDLNYKIKIIDDLRSKKYDLLLNSIYSRTVVSELFASEAPAVEKIALDGSSSNMPKEELQKYNSLYNKLIKSDGYYKSELKRHSDFLKGLDINEENNEPSIWFNQEDELFANELFAKLNLKKESTIALFAGAQHSLRMYDKYGKGINDFCVANGFSVIVLGSSADAQANSINICDITVPVYDLSGKTSIKQSAAILRRCTVAVGAETGLAHLACAVGIPNVIVIGGGHFGRFMPYSNLTSLIVNPMDCFGCNWYCKFNEARCIKNISAELIGLTLFETINKNSSKSRIFVESIVRSEEEKIVSNFVNLNEVEVYYVNRKGGIESNTSLCLVNQSETKKNNNCSEQNKNDRMLVKDAINLSESLIKNKDYLSARNLLSQTLTLGKENVEILNNLAVVDILENKIESAVETLNSIFNIEPENIVAYDNYRYLKENIKSATVPIDAASSFKEYFGRLRFPKQIGYPGLNDEKITQTFNSKGLEVIDFVVDIDDYKNYFEKAGYSKTYSSYYSFNIYEKSLEHYVAAKLLNMNKNDIYIDIASEGSPVPEIYGKLYGVNTYRQDLNYPAGLNGNTIGGDAANMPLPAEFASKMALHCSLEHFEGDADIRFIKEVNRVLKKGGSVCILPLYMAEEYCIITEPEVAVEQNVVFDSEAKVCGIKGWNNRHGRFYDVDSFSKRIINRLGDMSIRLYRVVNQKDVHSTCYLKFVALITK